MIKKQKPRKYFLYNHEPYNGRNITKLRSKIKQNSMSILVKRGNVGSQPMKGFGDKDIM